MHRVILRRLDSSDAPSDAPIGLDRPHIARDAIEAALSAGHDSIAAIVLRVQLVRQLGPVGPIQMPHRATERCRLFEHVVEPARVKLLVASSMQPLAEYLRRPNAP